MPSTPQSAVPVAPLTDRDGVTPPMGLPLAALLSARGGEPDGAGRGGVRFTPGALPSGGGLGVITVSSALTAVIVGATVQSVAGDRHAQWVLGRASGICTYLLLLALVVMGLVLAHPGRARWRRPSTVTRIRTHVALAAFTLAFLLLHIVVLATDKYAKVGWWGALMPMASQYRPVPVTLGVISLYAGLLAGVTSAFAGRWASRIWWPVHKVAAVSLALAWAHGVLAGTDSAALMTMYLGTGLAVVGLAIWRYLARAPR